MFGVLKSGCGNNSTMYYTGSFYVFVDDQRKFKLFTAITMTSFITKLTKKFLQYNTSIQKKLIELSKTIIVEMT